MQELKKGLKQRLDALATERDELKVKFHLAKMDLPDEWEKLEQKWEDFSRHVQDIGHQFKIAAHDINVDLAYTGEVLNDAAYYLLEDIKHGYREIRKKL